MAGQSWILAAVRTPIGAMSGALASEPAPRLGAACIRAVVERTGLDGAMIDDVIMGNVIGAGVGQNPARQAAIHAGLPAQVGAFTVNKVCGSGLKAVMLADQAIRAGDAGLLIAGGMENMTRAPYLLTRAREGYRLGHGEIEDAMLTDGLCDAYGQKLMGVYGDQCAREYGFTRAHQDDFAVESFKRARRATAEGLFNAEMIPVTVPGKSGGTVVTRDEGPEKFDEAKLRSLAPAFDALGTITAGNASRIGDGAAALLIGAPDRCALMKRGGAMPAVIRGSATFSAMPEWFTTAPVGAIRAVLDRVGWTVGMVDLFEINEAFAVVSMLAARELSIDAAKLNIHGGAVALGHPIGASGARILVTLLHALARQGGGRGVASLCIGGGEAVALAIEMPAS